MSWVSWFLDTPISVCHHAWAQESSQGTTVHEEISWDLLRLFLSLVPPERTTINNEFTCQTFPRIGTFPGGCALIGDMRRKWVKTTPDTVCVLSKSSYSNFASTKRIKRKKLKGCSIGRVDHLITLMAHIYRPGGHKGQHPEHWVRSHPDWKVSVTEQQEQFIPNLQTAVWWVIDNKAAVKEIIVDRRW